MKKLKNILHLFSVLSTTILIIFPLRGQAQTILKVPAYPAETCIVDYDQDGNNDIIVACPGGNQNPDSIVIFFNDGWGNFEEEKFEAGNRTYVYCKDLTGDAYPDIITRFPGSPDGVYFYENDQQGGLGNAHYIKDMVGNTFIGGIADIDYDGNLDIINYDITIPWEWGVAFNNGDFTFTDSAFIENSETWHRPNVGIINNDRRPDIVLTTYIQEESLNILYNYYPDFTISPLASPDWGHTHIMKIDNDSLNDILLERPLYIGSTWLSGRLNKGDYFRPCDTLVYPNGTGIKNTCDYNLDGYDDMTMIAWEEDSIYIYFNNQSCGFSHSQSVYMYEYSWLPTIQSGDLNSDGYPELVIQGFHMPRNSIRILWNDGTGHFVDTNTVFVYQNELDLANQINLYPNPTNSVLNIEMPNNYNFQKILVEIVDINGKTILKSNIEFHISQLNIGKFDSGIYLVKLQIGENLVTKRFLKQ